MSPSTAMHHRFSSIRKFSAAMARRRCRKAVCRCRGCSRKWSALNASGYAPRTAMAGRWNSTPTACWRCASSTRSIIWTASCSWITSRNSNANASAGNWKKNNAMNARACATPHRQSERLLSSEIPIACRPHMTRPLRVAFAGTPEFAVPALDALLKTHHEIVGVWTQPDRPAGRGRKLIASPVKRRALEHSLPIHQPATFKSAAARLQLETSAADVMVVTAYGRLLPAAVLAVPRYGCINIHASLLPRWRGAAPIQRAILAGDTETGITLMQMDQGLDTGDMLDVCRTAIRDDDTAQSLHERLATLGAAAMVELLAALPEVTRVPQNESAATYAAKLTRAEARVDWMSPA